MFVVFCLLALVASVVSVDDALDQQWLRYQELYNKEYSLAEEGVRRETWESNIDFINRHNMEADLEIHSFHVGINQFTDMTNEQFRKLNGYLQQDIQDKTNIYQSSAGPLPVTVDWRAKGYVTPVKNQLECGSCWAFSTTGSLEGQHFKKSGKLVSLSEQNLVDCSTAEGNKGCDGGLMTQAFDYIIKNNGLDTESCYPYEGLDGQCRFKASCVGATVQSYTNIKTGSEDDLQAATANVGPISVAIDASSLAFQFYRSGVFDHPSCSSTELDHGVLVVGYGVYGGKDYWLVKNSWSTIWGNQGYIMMSRNKNNQCGIATMATYPTV